jgi:osmotically-inducible protein OsmY
MKTDAQLKQDVISELTWEPSVNPAAIGIEVKDGIVTLAGHVDNFNEKWNAESAAQRVPGAQALAVEIDVMLPGYYQRNDADIAGATENVLQWTTYCKKDTVKVMAEKGWITLTGVVEREHQRRTAAWILKSLIGVTSVSNQIAIKPAVSLTAVKSDIDAALKRPANGESKNISVDVRGDHVTLSGSVHSWSERELVMHTAWGTPRVRNVVNNISIS